MSKMLSKMNLISVVQQLPNEDIETIQGYVEMIEEENQKLKQKYLNVVADYETTMAENKELKKQLDTSNELVAQSVQTEMKLRDENNRLRKEYQDTYKDVRLEIKEYKTQQKEFIKWLEDKIQQQETLIAENQEKSYFLIYEDEKGSLKLSSQKAYIRRIILEEILSKYKEIIGGKDE